MIAFFSFFLFRSRFGTWLVLQNSPLSLTGGADRVDLFVDGGNVGAIFNLGLKLGTWGMLGQLQLGPVFAAELSCPRVRVSPL